MGISTVQLCYDDGVSSGQVCQSAVSLTQEDGSSPDLLTNLAAWWALEEASGTRFNSHQLTSPASYHLTEGASAGNTTGKINNAWDPGGNSPYGGYLYIDESASSPMPTLLTATTLSGALWVKFNGITVGTGNFSQWLFKRGSLSSPVSDEISVSLQRVTSVSPYDMRIVLNVYGPGLNRNVSVADTVPTTGTWYFVYFYYDASAGQGGVSVNDGTIYNTAYDVDVIGNDLGVIQLGQFLDSASFYRRLNGQLDEVAVWTNRVLTTSEVTWLYNSGAGRSYADL